MKKKLFISVFAILNVSKTNEIVALIEEHKKDILATDFFEKVEIEMPNQDPAVFAVCLLPKSEEAWKAYNDGPRAEKRKWLSGKLFDTGLAKVIHSWASEIEIASQAS